MCDVGYNHVTLTRGAAALAVVANTLAAPLPSRVSLLPPSAMGCAMADVTLSPGGLFHFVTSLITVRAEAKLDPDSVGWAPPNTTRARATGMASRSGPRTSMAQQHQPDQQQTQQQPTGQDGPGTLGHGMMGRGGSMGHGMMGQGGRGMIRPSRQWIPTKMAASLRRRCTRSCTVPGDHSRSRLERDHRREIPRGLRAPAARRRSGMGEATRRRAAGHPSKPSAASAVSNGRSCGNATRYSIAEFTRAPRPGSPVPIAGPKPCGATSRAKSASPKRFGPMTRLMCRPTASPGSSVGGPSATAGACFGQATWAEAERAMLNWALRKIGATPPRPQNCRQTIPFRSRSDSWTFTPEQDAIGIETNFSRCPIEKTSTRPVGWPGTVITGASSSGQCRHGHRICSAAPSSQAPTPHCGRPCLRISSIQCARLLSP